MKKILSLLVIVIMLFSFSSCDGMIDFMGKMGNNIMGTDTSSADKAVESAKVSKDSLEKAEDRIEATDTGKTSISIGDFKVEVDGDLSGVDSMLPKIKDNVVNDIASALKNEQSTAKLVDEMKKAPEPEVAEAAKGTATVMNAVLSTYKEQIDNAMGDAEDGSVMSAVSDALNSLQGSLAEVASGDVTSGDVVTLQLIESFATDVVACVDTETGSIKEDADISSLISSANTLATVTSSLSSATKFNLDLQSIISGVMDAMNSEGEESRSLIVETYAEGDEEKSFIEGIEEADLTLYADVIRSLYKSLSAVAGNNEADFNRNLLSLTLHKGAYETYVNIASKSGSLDSHQQNAFNSFASFDGFFKYAVAVTLSEANRYYTLIMTDKDVDAALAEMGLADEKASLEGHNFWYFVTECVKANPWITDSKVQGPYHFNVPDQFEDLISVIVEAFSSEENQDSAGALEERISALIQGEDAANGQTLSALNTLKLMATKVKLSAVLSQYGGSFDFDKWCDDAIEWFAGTNK